MYIQFKITVDTLLKCYEQQSIPHIFAKAIKASGLADEFNNKYEFTVVMQNEGLEKFLCETVINWAKRNNYNEFLKTLKELTAETTNFTLLLKELGEI